jgi:hypothetical protein
MAVVLIGGVCVLAIGFLIFMSIVGGVIRMFRGGNYHSGGYREPPRQGWGWGRRHHQGFGHHHKPDMPHHPKPPRGGFQKMFGSSGGSSFKPSKSKSHFGGGGAKKKW